MNQHATPKILALSLSITCTLSACQTLSHSSNPLPTTLNTENRQFNITGKIGITTVKDDRREATSAFYAWGQDGERFAIDLTGAMGFGATNIRYNGHTATLTNDKTTLTADTPEELLFKTTGMHAPISHFPYWIVGKTAPSDTNSQFDNDKLISTQNGAWTVTFDYQHTLPNHLTINHSDGHRVVMTIQHR